MRIKARGEAGIQWSSASVAAKMDQCLRGKAERWYTSEISEVTRAGLRSGIDLWCTELVTRFRETPGVVFSRLEASYYIISDVRAKRDPEDYFQRIVADGVSAGTVTSEYA